MHIHYIINIGMVLGLLPTIGIPLPYLSYGGSGMLGFTLLLFIFLTLLLLLNCILLAVKLSYNKCLKCQFLGIRLSSCDDREISIFLN